MQQALKLPLDGQKTDLPFLPPKTEAKVERPELSTALEPEAGEFADFNWTRGAECVVVPSQPAVAVYLNPRGEVVIRQESQFDISEDHWVYLQRKNLRPLIERLTQIERGQLG